MDRSIPIEKIFDNEKDRSIFIEEYFYITQPLRVRIYTPSETKSFVVALYQNEHYIKSVLAGLCLPIWLDADNKRFYDNPVIYAIKFHHDDMLFSISSSKIVCDLHSEIDTAQKFFKEEYRKAPENRCFKDYPLKKYARIDFKGNILLCGPDLPCSHIEISFSQAETLKLIELFTGFAVGEPPPHLPEPKYPEKPHASTDTPSEQKDNPTMFSHADSNARTNEKKGSPIMSNPMNFGIVPIEDENINGTPLGIAVRTPGGGWNIYNQEKNTITDLGNIPLGNLPIWEIPAFKVKPGDTIINDNRYYHVTAVENGYISTIDIAAGVKEEQVKVKNIVGLSIYRKVVSCADLLGSKKHNVDDKLLLLMLSGSIQEQGDGAKQQAPNMLLPLMLMNNSNEKSTNKLLALSMMTNGGQGDQNNLMQLLLAKELFGDNDLECLDLDFDLGSDNDPNPDSNNVEPASGTTNSD